MYLSCYAVVCMYVNAGYRGIRSFVYISIVWPLYNQISDRVNNILNLDYARAFDVKDLFVLLISKSKNKIPGQKRQLQQEINQWHYGGQLEGNIHQTTIKALNMQALSLYMLSVIVILQALTTYNKDVRCQNQCARRLSVITFISTLKIERLESQII